MRLRTSEIQREINELSFRALLSSEQEDGILQGRFPGCGCASCAEWGVQIPDQRVRSIVHSGADAAGRGVDDRHESAVADGSIRVAAIDSRGG
jgi:hypothetical protein